MPPTIALTCPRWFGLVSAAVSSNGLSTRVDSSGVWSTPPAKICSRSAKLSNDVDSGVASGFWSFAGSDSFATGNASAGCDFFEDCRFFDFDDRPLERAFLDAASFSVDSLSDAADRVARSGAVETLLPDPRFLVFDRLKSDSSISMKLRLQFEQVTENANNDSLKRNFPDVYINEV